MSAVMHAMLLVCAVAKQFWKAVPSAEQRCWIHAGVVHAGPASDAICAAIAHCANACASAGQQVACACVVHCPHAGTALMHWFWHVPAFGPWPHMHMQSMVAWPQTPPELLSVAMLASLIEPLSLPIIVPVSCCVEMSALASLLGVVPPQAAAVSERARTIERERDIRETPDESCA